MHNLCPLQRRQPVPESFDHGRVDWLGNRPEPRQEGQRHRPEISFQAASGTRCRLADDIVAVVADSRAKSGGACGQRKKQYMARLSLTLGKPSLIQLDPYRLTERKDGTESKNSHPQWSGGRHRQSNTARLDRKQCGRRKAMEHWKEDGWAGPLEWTPRT
jgi:hypothetical protein